MFATDFLGSLKRCFFDVTVVSHVTSSNTHSDVQETLKSAVNGKLAKYAGVFSRAGPFTEFRPLAFESQGGLSGPFVSTVKEVFQAGALGWTNGRLGPTVRGGFANMNAEQAASLAMRKVSVAIINSSSQAYIHHRLRCRV